MLEVEIKNLTAAVKELTELLKSGVLNQSATHRSEQDSKADEKASSKPNKTTEVKESPKPTPAPKPKAVTPPKESKVEEAQKPNDDVGFDDISLDGPIEEAVSVTEQDLIEVCMSIVKKDRSKKDVIKSTIASFGGNVISEVDPSKYADLKTALEGLI